MKRGDIERRGGSAWLLIAVLTGGAVISCPAAHGGASGAEARPTTVGAGELHDELLAATSIGDDDAGGVDAAEEDLRDEERGGLLVDLVGDPLGPFFEALHRIEYDAQRTVRVLHWGDSHTAADFMTTAVRHVLQERFGDGGRGFVLLGKPWRSYRPKDVKLAASGDWRAERILIAADPATLDGRYGLGGVSVESFEAGAAAKVATATSGGFNRVASSFEVFYLKQPRGGSFRVLADGEPRATVSTAASRFGTGFVSVELDEGEHEFEVRINGDGRVRLFGAAVENDGPGIVYDMLGVNGGFFHTPLRWDADLLAEQVAERDPDLLITMYGTNEADSRVINPERYASMVRRTLARLRAGAPEAACMLLGPPDRRMRGDADGRPTQLDWIIEVQQEVADEIGCAFLDLKGLMGGAGSYTVWSAVTPPWALGDGIHLTVAGYRELGERMADEILEGYESYLAEIGGLE
jgi:lysophospholipase L1-like esterase